MIHRPYLPFTLRRERPPLVPGAKGAVKRLVLLAVGISCALAPRTLAAQRPVPADPQAEFRISATVSPRLAPHGGVGVNLRAGWYARLGVHLEAGATRVEDRWVASQRATLSARFLLDPFGQSRGGLYGGAGLSVRRVGDASPQGALVLLVGVEGRAPLGARRGALVPAVEVALGGGVQVGLVLRRGRADTR